MLSCFECVDDTVLTGKSILQELMSAPKVGDVAFNEGIGSVADLLRNKHACKVFLFLMLQRVIKLQRAY